MDNNTELDNKNKQNVAPEKPTFNLPILPTPQIILDETSGMAWIGLPLSTMDKLEATVQLDACKAHMLAWYKKTANRPKLVKPGPFAGLTNGLKQFVAGKR
jgi:hypothetical protein